MGYSRQGIGKHLSQSASRAASGGGILKKKIGVFDVSRKIKLAVTFDRGMIKMITVFVKETVCE